MSMEPETTSQRRLHELRGLISGLCDGELQPHEAARLEELVSTDETCCEYFVTAMHISAALPRYVGADRRSISSGLAELEVQHADALPSARSEAAKAIPAPLWDDGNVFTGSSSAARLPGEAGATDSVVDGLWSYLRPPIVLFSVGVLLVGAAIGWSLRRDRQIVAPAAPTQSSRLMPVAFLAADNGCSWGEDSVRLRGVGSTVDLGDDITLYEGTAEFRLSSGVSLSVEGPVAFVITSPTSVALQHGRITVYVPPEVRDFRMLASTCRITARRAEFGVHLGGNEIKVHSFWGDALVSPAPFYDSIDDGRPVAKGIDAVRREADLPSGANLAKVVVGPRRSLSLVNDGDAVRVAEWSAAKSGEFATKLTMGGELPITSDYVAEVLKAKPIGYWRFEKLSDGIAKNEIADGVDLRVVGNVRLWGDIQNRVLDFSKVESDAYLISQEPLQALAGSDYSIEVWIKSSHFHRGGLVALMENPGIERGKHGFLLETLGSIATPTFRTPKRLRFLHRDPPTSDVTSGTSCYSSGYYRVRRWQHLVAEKKASRMRLYVNGKLSATGDDASSLASDLFLVLRWTAGVKDDRFFFGQLDELAVYNRALSKEEIESHYNAIRWTPKTPSAANGRSPTSQNPDADPFS